jgi:Kef-type K+ transport system membrane component KefB
MPYLAYHQPGITLILSLTSFLLLLNAIRQILDHFLFCGIIGEILIGIIWGLPVGGTSWLPLEIQDTIQALGYLGLIGLVFEGGINTDMNLLRKTLFMSVSVATIGLLAPIALSFLLLVFPFSDGTPTPLAGFSAGAALCSTSLGTTFVILSSVGMQKSRVGTILIGAAMMDDVVGLVMVNIVTSLGNGAVGGWSIARPIVASFGLLIVTLVLLQFVLRPIWNTVRTQLTQSPSRPAEQAGATSTLSLFNAATTTKAVNRTPHLGFVLSILVLTIFVTIAAYIEASVLFAAFIAGDVAASLWDPSAEMQSSTAAEEAVTPAARMYHTYFRPLMEFILVPFFFVSILYLNIYMDVHKTSSCRFVRLQDKCTNQWFLGVNRIFNTNH